MSRRLQQLRQDIAYAVRQLRLAPVFTLTIVLTLALGIGVTTAIFSLIHAVMLKSLPVAEPGRLYQIGADKTCCATGALQGDWERFSYSLYKRVEQSAPQFDNIAAFQGNAGVLSVRDSAANAQARPLLGEYVSGNYFQAFGLQAFAGRLFSREDDRAGAPPVAVLSYRTWQQNYHGSPSVIGATVHIETYPFTVVGVAPPGFYGETLSSTPTEIWIPLETEYLIDGKAAFNLIPSQAWLHLIGHLRPGAKTDGVAAELTAVLQHWLITEAALPAQNRPQSPQELAQQTIQLAGDKGDHFINDVQLSIHGNLGELEPAIREAFRQVDPNFAIIRIAPVQQLVDTQFDQQNAVARLSSLFGVLALMLATVGLYGVTAYTVARRTSEIGVRVALGANRRDIVGLVFRGAFLQVGIGLLLGVPVAVGLGKMLAANLYQVGLLDVPALVTAIGTLVLGAGVASVVPARRAAGIDPAQALRAE